jgi:hypothetical protein
VSDASGMWSRAPLVYSMHWLTGSLYRTVVALYITHITYDTDYHV